MSPPARGFYFFFLFFLCVCVRPYHFLSARVSTVNGKPWQLHRHMSKLHSHPLSQECTHRRRVGRPTGTILFFFYFLAHHVRASFAQHNLLITMSIEGNIQMVEYIGKLGSIWLAYLTFHFWSPMYFWPGNRKET
ncbi:MAG: hypothetical protein JOS17DRAFT_754304 [Linnemannia elongata]|nr:MAG: hypothetical protein JOS17DRAFT_754304 [Linnemannia elongata]